MSNGVVLSNEQLEMVIQLVEQVTHVFGDRLVVSALDPEISKLPLNFYKGNSKFMMDMIIDKYYKRHLKKIFKRFVYLSEESDPLIFGTQRLEDAELLIIVDPLDTSEMAVRGLVGWTHLLVFDRLSADIILSVVGDFFHSMRIFYAFKSECQSAAYVRCRDGRESRLQPSRVRHLKHALITSFTMKPKERFLGIAKERALLNALSREDENGWQMGRIGLDFGSIGICHVAAGLTDAFIETTKGFAIWDLLPGLFILKKAGGFLVDLSCKDINPQLNLSSLAQISEEMATRTKFIASGTLDLAREIAGILRNPYAFRRQQS